MWEVTGLRRESRKYPGRVQRNFAWGSHLRMAILRFCSSPTSLDNWVTTHEALYGKEWKENVETGSRKKIGSRISRKLMHRVVHTTVLGTQGTVQGVLLFLDTSENK